MRRVQSCFVCVCVCVCVAERVCVWEGGGGVAELCEAWWVRGVSRVVRRTRKHTHDTPIHTLGASNEAVAAVVAEERGLVVSTPGSRVCKWVCVCVWWVKVGGA